MKLFISYSRDDKAWVYELWRALRDETHHDVWIDERISPSSDWWDSILKNIEDCDCIIYVMSSKSVESIYCKAEVAYALALNKPVFPLMLEVCNPPQDIKQRNIHHLTVENEMSLDRILLKIVAGLSRIQDDIYERRYNRRTAVRPTIPVLGILNVFDILPPPFEWCDIPAGKVEIKNHGWFDVPAFRMAKYPITVAQYEVFMKDGGYENQNFWTFDGWEARKRGWDTVEGEWKYTHKPWTRPRFWDDEEFAILFGADHPVIGVSWYEALAFSSWLSKKELVRVELPNEQQWQYAAQGQDNRIFPWGNNFDERRCNTWECGIKQTTPVTQYPTGASPYGVMDMSGNVWEWTVTNYEQAYNNMTIRGGSWYVSSNAAQSVCRIPSKPHYRGNFVGFRIMCASPNSAE